MKKIYVISLGCAKNLVDTEILTGITLKNQFELTSNFSEADIILINTCGFIESAKKEAIDVILEVSSLKLSTQKLVVTGCLVERYYEELSKELLEVDAFIPIRDYNKFSNILSAIIDIPICGSFNFENRTLFNNIADTYVRISDGCDNKCAYCAIPLIRGPYKSRSFEDILQEINNLVEHGAKRIILISQDVSRYGFDLYKKLELTSLLRKICSIKGDFKVMMLYLYPDLITDELIDFVANEEKMIPYFDIPIQHSETRLLKLMNRRGDKELIKNLIDKIRQKVKNSVIRTTLILGFPSETKDEVRELGLFIKEIKFDRLGAFTYSKEEDTEGAKMGHQIKEKEKERRLEYIMNIQSEISKDVLKKYLGKEIEVIVKGYNGDEYMYYGHPFNFAPDDADGYCFFAPNKEHQIGEIVKVKILDTDEYNVYGSEI